MSSRHFGERDHYTTTTAPNAGRRRFLFPLPHAGDECARPCCDQLRRENAAARRSVNWSPEYPPAFYGRVEVEDVEPAHPYYSAPVEPAGGGEWF